MVLFRILVEEIEPYENENGYQQEHSRTIYKQDVTYLDIWAVIQAVNGKEENREKPEQSK